MAEPRFLPGKIDPLRGFQVGRQQRTQEEQQRQGRVGLQQAQQRINQAAETQRLEQAQLVKEQRSRDVQIILDENDKILNDPFIIDNYPDLVAETVDASNKLTSEIRPGSPNLDANIIIAKSKEWVNDQKAVQILKDKGLNKKALELFNKLLPKYIESPAKVKLLGEQVKGTKADIARVQRTQRAAGIDFEKIFGADVAPLAKAQFEVDKPLPKPTARKTEVVSKSIGKGKVQDVLIDKTTGAEITTIGSPSLKFKPAEGKPPKVKDIVMTRPGKVVDGKQTTDFETVPVVDGKLNVSKLKTLGKQGYVMEKRRGDDTFELLSALLGGPSKADEGDTGELAETGEQGSEAPSFDEYKADLEANPKNLVNGKLKWDDGELATFYEEDFGVKP